MSLGELETYASRKADEEAAAKQAVQAAMQAAQFARGVGQAAKLSKERRLALLQKKKRSRRQGEWDVRFGRTPAGVRQTPDGAEDQEEGVDVRAAAAAAGAGAAGASKANLQRDDIRDFGPSSPVNTDAAGGAAVSVEEDAMEEKKYAGKPPPKKKPARKTAVGGQDVAGAGASVSRASQGGVP